MEYHVRILGTLSIVFGVFSAVAGLGTLTYFGGLSRLWTWAEASGGLGLIATGTVVLHLLVAVPSVVAGVFLRHFQDWSRYLMVFVCAVNLLNFPIGSLLGGYGLWVLFVPETEPLFLDPMLRRDRPLRPPQ